MIDQVTYDGLTDRTHTERTTVLDGHVKRSTFSVRLYSPGELGRMLRRLGCGIVDVYGQDAEPFAIYGPRLIVVATK